MTILPPAVVQYEQLVDVGDFRFATEASTLGWPVGDWPLELRVDRELGNGQPFHYMSATVGAADRDLKAVEYKQALGCLVIVVFND